jgi:peptide/nickel transport system ATP-binding protein
MTEQRVATARTFAGDPRLVILGNSTAALDLSMQATILNSLNDLQPERRTTYLSNSHDLTIVRHMADRVGLVYGGQFVEIGPAGVVFDAVCYPLHATVAAKGSRFVGARRRSHNRS